jgi:type I restriction enzyme S subunit
MNNELKPYDEYKVAPFPWLDSIPMHWQYKRAKSMYSKANRPIRETEEVVTCFRDGTVTLRKNRRTTGFTESIKEIGYQGIRKGDLVIHVMDAFAGAVGVSDSDGKGTPVYSVCIPKNNLNNYYYAHIVREMAKAGFIQSLYRGIRERSSDFRFEVFANQYLPIPPRDEQDQIVKYLDFQLAKINKFIKAKKKLITDLKEQKQVIINEAVTRGINPNVKMKPSGIEWLGDIPEHWDIRKLRYLSTKFGSGVTPKGGAAIYVEKGIPFLRSQNIRNDGLQLTNVSYITKEIHEQMQGSRVYSGDVLLNITGASIGRVCATPENLEEANVNQHVCIIRPEKKNLLPQYLVYYLSTPYIQEQIIMLQNGASREGLPLKVIKSFNILLPSINEQLNILDSITQKIDKINKSIATVEKEILLITEYRTTLTSDVVTGKVDVRDIKIDNIEDEYLYIDELDNEVVDSDADIDMGESED